LCYFHK